MPGVQVRPGLPAAPSAPRRSPPLLSIPEMDVLFAIDRYENNENNIAKKHYD
jgi:hypothetical protein